MDDVLTAFGILDFNKTAWMEIVDGAPLLAIIIAMAPALFDVHSRSARYIVPTMVAAFRPIIEPAFFAKGAATGFA